MIEPGHSHERDVQPLKERERTHHVFSSTAATYDAARAKLIPGFATFYTAAVSLFSEPTDRVLDLGAGTGLLSAFVRERLPDAHLHLIDNSEPMLAQARERFLRDENVVTQLGDYTTCDWGHGYDAVVSALSIHHLDDGSKQQLFARVMQALTPEGLFVNAEQILQRTPELEQLAREQWLHEVRALGATEQQIADSLLRQTEDRCATVSDQLQWLADAGFVHVRCVHEMGRFAVFVASAPE